MSTFMRQQWIEASHFHDLTEKEVLQEVAARARKVERPLVLLDLDSTLYEVGPRSFQILREWHETGASASYPTIDIVLNALNESHVGYSIRDTFRNLGLELESREILEALEEAKKFWSRRFFTSAYLPYDRPYPGAPEFARELYEVGAELVYLTGRDEPQMGQGTRENLVRDGFPWGVPRTHLLMKERAEIPDLDHKKNAAHFVRARGTLVASFENEPPNLVALSELFPEAMHIFLDTVCSDHPCPAGRGLYRIRHFGQDSAASR
ncbi:MAG: HAD family hydrolase [Bdellovibrionota bacterium]